ncbi:MAG: hypothetical protein FJ291_04665 [Planctomycetes bacterium]|nr:hypothetical protein [Planctomycetota bacterium]
MRFGLGLALALASCVAGAGAADVEALAKEVASCGWLVFTAHPAEIGGGALIANPAARGQADLYLGRPNGSGLRNITNTKDYTEYGGRFSHDGKRLLYFRIPSSKLISHDQWGAMGELVIANPDGSNPVVQGKEGQFPWAAWGPDDTQIACLRKREGRITVHDLATKRIVKEFPNLGIYQQLGWSPDGKRFCGTANVAGHQWNIVSIDLAKRSLTLLTRALNCTPDWFQDDPDRVLYSNRTPGMTPRLGLMVNSYGFTVLMQATADGKSRTLVYGALNKHVYFGCTSPDSKYAVFADDPNDGFIVGELRLVRLADTPIIAPKPPFPELKERCPIARDGPVLDLKLPNGAPLRGFEPHWTYAEIGGK